MNELAIRSMREEDILPVVTWMIKTPLWQRYAMQSAEASAQFIAALQRAELLLVADVGVDDLACGLAWCVADGAFARSAYLRLFGVRADYTHKGVGTRLLAELERRVAQTGNDLFLLVSDFNVAAQRFYQKRGYRQVGALPGYVLSDVTELIFRKQLTRNI